MIQFFKSIFEILFSLFDFSLSTASDFVVTAVPSRRKTGYNADFDHPSAQLQKNADGFKIGSAWGNGLEEANSHLICLGGSGSKKSSCICFPTLLQSHATSYVVYGGSYELANGCATEMYNKGYELFMCDYDNIASTIGFNALSKCRNETDIYKQVNTVFINRNKDVPYDYWMQSAETLTSFCTYSLWRYADSKFINYYNVLHMLQVLSYAPESIDKWVIATGDERLINQYKSILSTPEKTLLCSISTAKTALAVYGNPTIGALTAFDSLDFEKFTRKRCALFICGSPAMTTYCSGITASFFESFFASLLHKLPQNGSIGVRFIIDEASSIRLSTLPQVLAIGRKFFISVATLWQDYNQIESIYGKNEAADIFANSRLKVFMPSGQPIATCRMLSELLGKYEYLEDDGVTLKTRELLTSQEIYQLKKILVLNGNNRPTLLEPRPFFEDKNLLQKTKQPVFQFKSDVPLKTPPLIQFPAE